MQENYSVYLQGKQKKEPAKFATLMTPHILRIKGDIIMAKIILPGEAIRRNCFISNSMVQSSNLGDLTLMQWRLISYLLSQYIWEDEDIRVIPVDIPSFCKLYNIHNYDAVIGAIDDLYGTNLQIINKEGIITRLPWVAPRSELKATIHFTDEYKEFVKDRYTVPLMLNQGLKPYVLNRDKCFTTYKYGYTVRFSSKYAYALYMWLSSFRSMSNKPIKIHYTDFYRQFSGGKYKSNFRNFEINVLNPAIRNINRFSDLIVEYDTYKPGKFVYGIIFRIKQKSLEECEKLLSDLNSREAAFREEFWNL